MKNVDKEITISDLLHKSLYGELSEDEQTMLDCWLEDEGNREFYRKLLQPEKFYEEVLEMVELDTGLYYRKLQWQMDRKRRFRIWWAVASVAAVLMLFIGILWPLKNAKTVGMEEPYQIVQQSVADQTILKTEKGEVYTLDDSIKQIKMKQIVSERSLFRMQESQDSMMKTDYNLLSTSSRGNIEVTLSDSTRVWLNAGSRLRYPSQFTGDKREVELVGEAYFEVAHNEQQPFLVKTETTQIEVLGTQFNVNAKEGTSCITTLIRGCVKLRNKLNDTVVIYPGQQVNTPAEGVMVVKSVDTRFYTAWKRNRFAFHNEPLYRILEQLSEWYGCTFEFVHPRLANLHFTTILPRYEEISQVLNILQATREFGFIKTGQHICIMDYEPVN